MIRFSFLTEPMPPKKNKKTGLTSVTSITKPFNPLSLKQLGSGKGQQTGDRCQASDKTTDSL